jgi:glutamate/tyrosine decarboxylase-like PLP-dependent enzyme
MDGGPASPRKTMTDTDHRDLDPADWDEVRALGHRMIDDMIDHLRDLRQIPAWQKMPPAVRDALHMPLPEQPTAPAAIYADIERYVTPYVTGNTHPRFMGWVHGGGNVMGMLAEMIAAGLNPNVGGRDHSAVLVERQVVAWSATMVGMPEDTSGVLVTGSSMANFIALTVARTAYLGGDVRRTGVGEHRLTAYTSEDAHSCMPRAMDQAGMGSDALRMIPSGPDHRIRLELLRAAVAADRAAGFEPFMVTGNAGTVSTGAVDDLAALGEFCRAEGLWFHVDAAYGAFGMLSPRLRPVLRGIERADSVAFDFHKWGQVPYDAGIALVRDPAKHLAAFDHAADYLRREKRGLATGELWPCDLGPDLSRGFRALKVWTTLRAYGTEALGRVAEQCCDIAAALGERILADARLELLAPVGLNVVCFRVRAPEAVVDALNADVLADIQEAGLAVPSSTMIDGKFAIRAAIVNHRTRVEDAFAMLDAVLAAAAKRG